MNAQRRSVNLVPGMSAPAVLHASEGDVGRVLEIVIIDGQLVYNIPSTATVTITATKPSGMGFTQACTVTENGTATFETTASMTDESGKMQAEVRIVDGGKNIGTANLLWIVERNPHPSNVIDGDVERAKTILERADEAMAKAEQMIEEVEIYNSIVEEVEDARNGFDGVEYGTLGEAVRGQFSVFKNDFNEKTDIIQSNIGAYNYFDITGVSMVDATGTGAYRSGYDFGILPAGTYVLTFELDEAQLPALAYLTKIVDDQYISTSGIQTTPYAFKLDEDTHVLIRSNKTTEVWPFINTVFSRIENSITVADTLSRLESTRTNGSKYPFTMPSFSPFNAAFAKTTDGKINVSKNILPKGTLIEKAVFYVEAAQFGYIILFSPETNVVLKVIRVWLNAGWNTVPIRYRADQTIGYALRSRVRYLSSTSVSPTRTFTGDIGLYQSSATSVKEGDVLTVSQVDSAQYYVFGFQLICYGQDYGINNGWTPKGLQLKGGIRYADIPAEYGLCGRWYPAIVNSKICNVSSTSGAEILMKTHNTKSLTLSFESMSGTNNYYAISIDGAELIRKPITDNVITLTADDHIVRIVMDGISEHIDKWNTGNGYAFYGATVDDAGYISGLMPESPIILFAGDSITEGIMALGTSDDMGDTNSATNSFPWFCCQHINAFPLFNGYGGTGIGATGSFHKAIDAVRFLNKKLKDFRHYPNAIVLNYGTNDTSMASADFVSEYTKLIAQLRQQYSGVPILVMIPFGQRHADDIRTVCTNDPTLILVDTSTWEGITYTDGTHPDAAGAKVAGEYLATFIEMLF